MLVGALLLLILVAWVVGIYSGLMRQAAAQARRSMTQEPRMGVSLFPVIPLIPFAIWGIALLVDLAVDPWGTAVVAAIHAAWLVLALLAIGRDAWRLRGLKRGD
jgi:hypothetical protein